MAIITAWLRITPSSRTFRIGRPEAAYVHRERLLERPASRPTDFRKRNARSSKTSTTKKQSYLSALPGQSGNKLNSCVPALFGYEVLCVLDLPADGVLLQVCAVDGVLDTLASCANSANWDLAMIDLDASTRLCEKRVVPALRLQAPGSDENAILYHDHPDADESMFPVTRAKAQPVGRITSLWPNYWG